MRELTKHAVATFYEEDLKHRLKDAFDVLMDEMKEIPDDVYSQYATNALKNLVQLSAKGVSDLNVIITEYLNDAQVLYGNYEETFKKIKTMDEMALSKKHEQEAHYEAYMLKKAAYNRLRQEYAEEKGEASGESNGLSQIEEGSNSHERINHYDERIN